jgi:hypothetical protein
MADAEYHESRIPAPLCLFPRLSCVFPINLSWKEPREDGCRPSFEGP